jgi:hypothetical protein
MRPTYGEKNNLMSYFNFSFFNMNQNAYNYFNILKILFFGGGAHGGSVQIVRQRVL